MREIKFRAWDKNKKNWESSFSISNEGLFMRLGIGQKSDEMVIQQFTGLLDKNGKEVYEKDVVRIEEVPNNNRSYFSDKVVEWRGFQLYPFCLNHIASREVIGNVFENPELIK